MQWTFTHYYGVVMAINTTSQYLSVIDSVYRHEAIGIMASATGISCGYVKTGLTDDDSIIVAIYTTAQNVTVIDGCHRYKLYRGVAGVTDIAGVDM